ncbi:MAG: DUF4157 domain-containing protein [Caldilinea sp. CFX5]|nr:DUF4157 domain-containing protein [Caldilinea sp. CFX5]
MAKQLVTLARQQERKAKPYIKPPATHLSNSPTAAHLGNGAIQRMLAQRVGGDSAFDLDDSTANRINHARGSGQALDGAVQAKMGESMSQDFSHVRVHTGSESHALNEQLNAKAFTTGSDIFFRDGAYSPQSSSGQELIAHELTHVVQQGSGAVGGSVSAMQVNAPGDRFEQEADAVSKAVTSTPTAQVAAPTAQRQEMDKDKLMTKRIQRATPDDKDPLQKADMPAEEETAPQADAPEPAPEEEKAA